MNKPPYDPEALPPDLRRLLPNNYQSPSVQTKSTSALQSEKIGSGLSKKVVTPQRKTKQKKQKSSAQVATLVRPQVVSPISGGLRPKRKRPHRLMGRFSKEEKETVETKAESACLSVNEFIRISTLGDHYASSLNPELRQRFIAVHRELCRQGDAVVQIGDHLDANAVSPEEANSMLGIIARSLMASHKGVLQALAAASEESYV